MTDYQPISCDLYSQYEVAVMHRTPLRVRWRDTDGVTHLAIYFNLLKSRPRQSKEILTNKNSRKSN